MKVEQVNKFAKVKQRTDRDIRYLGPLVSDRAPLGLVTVAGQTVINLTFAVQQTTAGKQIFFLSLDGVILAETTDFTYTNIISGQCSQVTLTTPAVAGMQIDYWKIGTNSSAFPNPSSVQANLNTISSMIGISFGPPGSAATYTDWNTMIAAVSSGSTIYVMQGTYTPTYNYVVSKTLLLSFQSGVVFDGVSASTKGFSITASDVIFKMNQFFVCIR